MRAKIVASAVVAAVVGLSTPAAAGGRYSDFGNIRLGDCDYASVANLVQHEYPGARISTAEVVAAWRSYGLGRGESGLDFFETSGIGGYRLANYAPVTTRAQFIAGANAGGLQALILGGQHAVAVIHASSRGVTFIMDGRPRLDTWRQWTWDQRGVSQARAVTWGAPASTTALKFTGTYETSTMTDQVEPTGTVAPIEPLGMVNLGYTFDGWSLTSNDTGPLLQSGQSWNFSKGATLYAVWTYAG